MSLDISVTLDGETLHEMNWFRNPFGLLNWADANVGMLKPTILYQDKHWQLWDVVNEWAYDKAEAINNGTQQAAIYRKLFRTIVENNWVTLKELEQGFFGFNLPQYMDYVQPHYDKFPLVYGGKRIEGSEFEKNMLKIPMEYFTPDMIDLGHMGLAEYQEWFYQLLELGVTLENNLNTRLDVSN